MTSTFYHFFHKAILLFLTVIFLFISVSTQAQIVWSSSTGSSWLTGGNWTGGTIPSAGEVAQFNGSPTSATNGIGLNMDTASGIVPVGAIYLSPLRTINLILGNSAVSTPGILTLNGATVNGIPNVILANLAASNARLQIQNKQGAGASTMGIDIGTGSKNIVTGAGGTITAGNTISINNVISGNASINFMGGGTRDAAADTGNNGGILRLSAANLFSGGITVGLNDGSSNGILELDTTDAIANLTGNDITINGNSQLYLAGGTGRTFSTNNILLHLNGNGNAYTASGKGALVNLSNNSYTWTGNIDLASDAGINVGTTATASVTLTGNISGVGQLTKVGIGNLILSGTGNSWSGGTQINSGKITVSAGSYLAPGALLMAQTGTTSPSITFNNAAQTLTSLSSSFTGTNNTNNVILNGTRLTLNQNSNTIFGGSTSTLTSTITGTGSLVKTGTGRLTLTSAANTFSGGLKIVSGEIRYNPKTATTVSNLSPDTLAGGTLSTNGIDRTFTFTFGTLALTENSVIDLGTDTLHSIKFANSSAISWTAGKILTITNWKGSWNSTTGTKGRLFIGITSAGITAAQRAQIVFIDGSGNTFSATQLSTGEIVPLAPTITTTPATYGGFCNTIDNFISVGFTYTGPISAPFYVQLSGPTGVFTNDFVTNIIGTGTTSPITATIPMGTAAGTAYRVRVINNSVINVFGTNNGSNVSVTGTPVLPAITGSPIVALASNVTWKNTTSGGTWSSNAPSVASVNTTGVVTGLSLGSTYITYTVTNFCGLSSYVFDTITVVAIPTILAVTPTHGNAGTTVTITGSNFNAVAANNVVYFGATRATVSSATGSSLVVTVPVNAMYEYIKVTDLTTGLQCYSPGVFNPTYDNTGLMPDSVNFKPKVNFTSGATPVGVTLGDLDGDGRSDMIVVNSGPNNIYVYHNISTSGTLNSSSFATPNIYVTGNGPHYAKIADMDGDGLPEILVANLGFNTISIFKNQSISGVISFAAPVTVSTSGGPLDMSIADFDGDGRPDIAVVNQNSAWISVLRNIATTGVLTSASFTSTIYLSTSLVFPYRIFAGDLDNDGKPDISFSDYGNNKVYVMHNNFITGVFNATSFSNTISLTTETSPAGINAADIDGDGKPEIVVANSGSNTISVFRNTNTVAGTMSFTTGTTFPTETAPEDLAIGDVDGDNKIDIAVANYSANNVSIFRNTATAGTISASSLATRKNFNTGVDVGGVAFSDMDSDGKPDLAVVSTSTSSVAILKNYPLPPVGTITGADTICKGTTTTLTNLQPGGTWVSNQPSIATITSTGVVTGVAAGSATITYYTVAQSDTNRATFNVYIRNSDTVRAITAGTTSVCTGALLQLHETATSGSWSSNLPSIATVDNNGFVTGVGVGTAMISYAVTSGCYLSFDTINVNVTPGTGYVIGIVSGPSALCAGSAAVLTDTSTSGTWSSSNTVVATVNNSGSMQALNYGNTTITYAITTACGLYQSTLPVMVDTPYNASAISGPSFVCTGASLTLTDIAGPGGIWTASNSNATVSSAGVVTGINVGIDTITYTITNTCGTASGRKIITVSLSPDAGTITGPSSVCQAATINLSSTATGGTWQVTNSKAQPLTNGDIKGITAGTDTVLYLVTTGCGTDTASAVLVILPLPNAGVLTGASSLCLGASTTIHASVAGGVWSAKIGLIGTADSVITGLAAGIDTIRYTITNSCGSAIAIRQITVNAITPVDTIAGPSSVCTGAAITLTNATAGGTWSKTNAKANVSSGGVVTGISAGIDTIKYTPLGTCPMVATKAITVNQTPSAGTITGSSSVCLNGTITLHNTVPNGTWSVVGTHIAVADSVVTGLSIGSDTVIYTVNTSCGLVSSIKKITVSPLPYVAKITGDSLLYVGEQTTLKDSTTGGVWSVKGLHAIISSTGKLGALIVGQDTVRYTVSNACGSTAVLYPINIIESTAGGDVTDIKLYPNPNNGNFSVLLSSSLDEDLSVVIANSAFQVINVVSVHTNTSTNLNADNLANGVYMLSVVSKKGWHTVKFVIAK